MLTTDQVFELAKTRLKYNICKIKQTEDGLRFIVKMEHEMKPVTKNDEHEVVELRPITGGKGGGVNWLSNLPIGTVFLCKDKKQGCILTQFHVQQKYKKSALLMSNYPGPDFRVFVEMAGFSGENELIEIMKLGEELSEKGDNDGSTHSDDAGLDQS